MPRLLRGGRASARACAHQRRRIAASRIGARARAARAIRAGSTPASAVVFSGAWIVSDASVASASASSAGGNAVEVRVARRGPPALALRPGSAVRSSGHAPRSSISRWSASSSGAASVVERTTTCWPGCASRQ